VGAAGSAEPDVALRSEEALLAASTVSEGRLVLLDQQNMTVARTGLEAVPRVRAAGRSETVSLPAPAGQNACMKVRVPLCPFYAVREQTGLHGADPTRPMGAARSAERDVVMRMEEALLATSMALEGWILVLDQQTMSVARTGLEAVPQVRAGQGEIVSLPVPAGQNACM
jgi:hypothetical protein